MTLAKSGKPQYFLTDSGTPTKSERCKMGFDSESDTPQDNTTKQTLT